MIEVKQGPYVGERDKTRFAGIERSQVKLPEVMGLRAMTIPVNEPLLDGNEERYLAECVRTGWISSEGPFVRKLEEGFAARVGRRHGIAVCNGSVALDIAIAALGIGRGDEVILPSFTIISCAAAVVRAGATPVLVDCEPTPGIPLPIGSPRGSPGVRRQL